MHALTNADTDLHIYADRLYDHGHYLEELELRDEILCEIRIDEDMLGYRYNWGAGSRFLRPGYGSGVGWRVDGVGYNSTVGEIVGFYVNDVARQL